MQGNKSSLTISQSLKIYTGNGLAGTIIGFAAYETIFYAGIYVTMALIIAWSDRLSFTEAAANIAKTPAFDVLMALAPALLNCLILLVPHDRFTAGGKFFRTIKGGFGTFEKSRLGIYISALSATLVFCAIVLIFDLLGIAAVRNRLFSEMTVLVSSFVALGAGTFALPIRSESLRACISFIVCLAVTAGITIMLSFNTAAGQDLLTYAAIMIAGAVLILISVKMYIAYYKKYIWDN